MNFLAPSVLWALGLLVIPIIIHLFQLRRYKRVLFSDIRFLEALQNQTKHRQQLKHLLVLLMRLLAFAALIFAFAQPFIPKGNSQLAFDAPVYIFLDTSPSMEADGPKGNLMNHGKEKVLEILAAFGPQHPYKLLHNLQPRPERDFSDATEIKRTLVTLYPNGPARNFESILKTITQDLKNEQPARLFYISDFQTNSFDSLAQTTNPNLQVTLVPLMEAAAVSNLSIDSVWLQAPVLQPGFEQELFVALTNHDQAIVQSTQLQLILNDLLRGAQTIEIPAGEKKEVSLTFTPNETGLIKGLVRIEDSPIKFDDDYYFALEISTSKKAYHIYEGAPHPKINKILTDDFCTYDAAQIQKIDFKNLEAADLVVLEGLTTITSGLAAALANNLASGKNLFIIPPTEMRAGAYASLENLLEISFGNIQNDSVVARTLHYADPYFSGVFQERSNQVLLPSANKYYQLGGKIKPLVSFPNGQVLAGRVQKTGQAVVLATPLMANWTNLEQHPVLIPLVYQGLIYRDAQKTIAHDVGTLGLHAIEIPNHNADLPILLRDLEQGTELIPPKQQNGTQHQLFAGEVVEKPGFYSVVHNNQNIGLMAFNTGKDESLTQYFPAKQLERELANRGWSIGLEGNNPTNNLTQTILENEKGKPLWPYFVMAALAFLLFEGLLIRWKQT